jgi:hypothetical protein
MSTCTTHDVHAHTHGPDCGHASVEHEGHVDYLHDGHAHHEHGDHWDECDPADLHATHAHDDGHDHGPDCGHDTVEHDGHVDYLVGAHRHAPHGDHCDEH